MKKIYLVLWVVFLFVASCQQPEKVDSLIESKGSEVVKSETVLKVARNFDALISVASGKSRPNNARIGSKEKNVEEITPFKDNLGVVLYYVITYKEGGFIIVSAEKKTMPILAFSETGSFKVKTDLPAGVSNFMNYYKEGIAKIRLTTSKIDPIIEQEWARFENSNAIDEFIKTGRKSIGAKISSEPTDPECHESQIYTNPLITTQWGQSCGYNGQMPVAGDYPSLGCSLFYDCSHFLTGCDALAMAQVMNFHKFPNSFTWNGMGSGVTETQRLLRNVANQLSVVYHCGSTSAYPSSIPSAFISYGYNSSVYHANFNSTVVMSEIISYGRPVILSGWNSSGGGGHTWVADGVYQNYTCTNGWSVPMFHMNWGWEGADNGYYGSLTPSGFDFNYNVQMEANIHP